MIHIASSIWRVVKDSYPFGKYSKFKTDNPIFRIGRSIKLYFNMNNKNAVDFILEFFTSDLKRKPLKTLKWST